MSLYNNWFTRFPTWIWFSLIPIYGGASLIYAGWKARTSLWIKIGIGFILGGWFCVSYSIHGLIFLWVAQIYYAFTLKREYLVKTAPRGETIPTQKIAGLLAKNRGQIDINNCSKDDIVYDLGLPLAYANDIEILKNEGYIFTHIEELGEVVGIPETVLERVEPLIIFRYDPHKETDVSWRRLNTFSIRELIDHGIPAHHAEYIVMEREKNGQFKSLVSVRKRTNIPISVYRHLV